MQLFSKHNIDDLDWSAYPDGAQIKILLYPLITQGTASFIHNVDHEIQILATDEALFPLVLGNPKRRLASYLCSPLSQYFDLAKEEVALEMAGKRSIYATLAPYFLNTFRQIFSWLSFDKVVFVNNWILSTNLYPAFSMESVEEIRNFLIKKFPKHSVIFRSVNDQLDQALHEELTKLRFIPIISRPVLMLDPASKKYKKKRMFKMDQKLWQKNKEYYWENGESIQVSEIPEIQKLYYDLYLDKYSSLNPDYKPEFIQLLVESEFLEFQVLRKEEKIYGVTAFFKRNGIITTPFIGYEQSIPTRVGLYRFLNYRLMEEAIDNNLMLHMSSGAADFKRLRGGEPSLEFNMVYDRHLSPWRKFPWRLYYFISERVVIPSIRKFGL